MTKLADISIELHEYFKNHYGLELTVEDTSKITEMLVRSFGVGYDKCKQVCAAIEDELEAIESSRNREEFCDS